MDDDYNQPIPYVIGAVDVTDSPFFGLPRSDAALTERPACPECSGRLESLAPASRGAMLVQCDDCCNEFEVAYNPTTETFTVTRLR